jgi:hypothetical protein
MSKKLPLSVRETRTFSLEYWRGSFSTEVWMPNLMTRPPIVIRSTGEISDSQSLLSAVTSKTSITDTAQMSAVHSGDLNVISPYTTNQRHFGFCWGAASAEIFKKNISTFIFGRQLYENWVDDVASSQIAQNPGPHDKYYDLANLFGADQYFKQGLFKEIVENVKDPFEQSNLLIWITLIKYLGNLWRDRGPRGTREIAIEMNNFLIQLSASDPRGVILKLFTSQFKQEHEGFKSSDAVIQFGPYGMACIDKIVELFQQFLRNREEFFDVYEVELKSGITDIEYGVILDAINEYTTSGLYVSCNLRDESVVHEVVIGRVREQEVVIKNSHGWNGQYSSAVCMGIPQEYGIMTVNLKEYVETGKEVLLSWTKINESRDLSLITPTLVTLVAEVADLHSIRRDIESEKLSTKNQILGPPPKEPIAGATHVQSKSQAPFPGPPPEEPIAGATRRLDESQEIETEPKKTKPKKTKNTKKGGKRRMKRRISKKYRK